jgi:phospholipase A1
MRFSKFLCCLALFFVGILSAHAEEDAPTLLQLYQYKPIYFLMGNPYTKIELSFKTQIVRDVPVYLGYTQLMFWDLFISSPYFYDIDYNPLVWYRLSFNSSTHQWIDLIPFEHESNGKGGAEERSWNRVALAYHQSNRIGERMKLTWDLKAWVPIYYNPNNPDLAQYRGLWEVDLALQDFLGRFFDFNDVIFRLYPGGDSLTNPLHGGQELTLRLRSEHRAFLPLFVAQLFHGYGEYLQNYQYEHWGVRAGLGF